MTAKTALRDRASIASQLLYDSYDPAGQVFVQRDGSLALAWALGMKDTEIAPDAELRSLADRLAGFFKHLPPQSAGQFILRARRDVGEVIEPFRRSGDPSSPLASLFDAHCDMLEKLAIPHAGRTFAGRILELYFTLRVFPPLAEKGDAIGDAYAREKERLLEHAAAIDSFFVQMGIAHRRLEAAEVLQLLYATLNPRRVKETGPRAFREDLPIRDQVVRSAVRFDYDTGIVSVEGTATKLLSMVEKPLETRPGMVSRPDRSGIGVLDLIPEASLVFNFEVQDDIEMRKRFEKRDAFAWRQLQGPRKKLDLVRIKEDAEAALGELMNGGRALSVRFHVVLSDETEAAVLEKSRTVLAALDRLGVEMVEEDALGLDIFLPSLPMNYHPECDRGRKRAFTFMSSELADMLPLYGSFRGTPTPEVLLQNRRGEMLTFSPFDSDVAPHMVVTGVSGAGKSFMMNYALASAARRGGHVLILDKGNSYRNLCEIVGGQYVVYDPNRPLRINPIGRAEEMDKERLLFVKGILSEMCAQGEEPIRKEERTVLENSILRAVERKGKGEVFLSDVYQALLEEAKQGPRSLARDLDRLVLSLKPFTGNGAYAGFFDGPSEIDFRQNFTVFELAEIAKRTEVAPSILMAIMHNVAGFFGAPENLGLKKFFVIDEAWALLKSAATARFLEDVLRTYRKLNAAAVLVTQQVTDFEGPTGTAIRANAPNRIFLRQTAETVLAMEKLFELSPEVKAAISSLETAKGRFSEMFIETPATRGIARLVPSRELYTAFSTDGDDRARLLGLVAEKARLGDATPLLSAIREIAGISGGNSDKGKAH